MFPLFFLLARSGLRPGEGYALTWKDVDVESRLITVTKTLHRTRKRKQGEPSYRVGITKTSESRRIDMTDGLRAMLTTMRAQRAAASLETGQEPVAWVFHNNGEPLHESSVRDHMLRILKHAGVPQDFHPHCLRHSYASHLLGKGVSVYNVSRQLGHRDMRTTVNVYGHWIPDAGNAAANVLENDGGDQYPLNMVTNELSEVVSLGAVMTSTDITPPSALWLR